MSVSDWDSIIEAITNQSGSLVDTIMSKAALDRIQVVAGVDIPPNRRRGVRRLPRVRFEQGLSDAEVTTIEMQFKFRFPPDLRAFLQTALPIGPGFPDWRAGDEELLHDWLSLPLQGILFDIEHNDFWLNEWGSRPKSLREAVRVASRLIASAPRLIPIYRHRMMPDEPFLPGNPVFSVHQSDIIYYGFDLADYLHHEFGLPGRDPWPDQVRTIRFWDLDRFLETRWVKDSAVFDNSGGPPQ